MAGGDGEKLLRLTVSQPQGLCMCYSMRLRVSAGPTEGPGSSKVSPPPQTPAHTRPQQAPPSSSYTVSHLEMVPVSLSLSVLHGADQECVYVFVCCLLPCRHGSSKTAGPGLPLLSLQGSAHA